MINHDVYSLLARCTSRRSCRSSHLTGLLVRDVTGKTLSRISIGYEILYSYNCNRSRRLVDDNAGVERYQPSRQLRNTHIHTHTVVATGIHRRRGRRRKT